MDSVGPKGFVGSEEVPMAGLVLEESGVGRSNEGSLSLQSSQSGEALAEWRSSEQVENGTQLTTAPYWDTDNDDDGGKWFSILQHLFSHSSLFTAKSCTIIF